MDVHGTKLVRTLFTIATGVERGVEDVPVFLKMLDMPLERKAEALQPFEKHNEGFDLEVTDSFVLSR